jgi:hypothetical protein
LFGKPTVASAVGFLLFYREQTNLTMIKILMVHPLRNDATCFYRALGPLLHMQKKGMIELIDGSVSNFEYSWANIMKCDILFFQRPVGKDHLEIMRMAKRLMKPVWIDFDDDYLSIPESNPRHEIYHIEGRQYLVADCIREADVVSVSTKAIADSYSQFNKNIVVIPNAYDETLFEPPVKRNAEKVILFRAGDTYMQNLDFNKEAILKCFFEYPEYTWVFMGKSIPLWLTENPDVPNERLKLYDFYDIMVYFERLMEINPEIMIVPFEDNQFNRSRSNNAWIEGTLAGAIVVATDLPEFQQPGVITAPIGNFKTGFDFAVNCNKDAFFELSKENIPSLDTVNKQRFSLVCGLMNLSFRKITPRKIITPLPFSVSSNSTLKTDGRRKQKDIGWPTKKRSVG